MKKQKVISLALFFILIAAFMVAPVAGGLTISTQGNKIISRTGATSPVITVNGTDIPKDGNITIDISNLAFLVVNGTITNANVEVGDTAAEATWTRQVAFNGGHFILNLTSTNNATVAGETVTVTFTGAAGGNSAWYSNTGNVEQDLTATRSDTLETSDTIIFLIQVTPGSGGLTTAPGTTITTTTGATSMVITVTGEPILQHDIITIPVYDLNGYTGGGTLTDANVVISDDAAGATWTGIVDPDGMLTLTSNAGDTAVDENVTVNFTGAGPNPWKAGSVGNTLLTASRPDNYASADFNFVISINPPSGYTVAADFTGSPTAEIAPFTVTFSDKSIGNATSWDWDWGDGTVHGITQDPTHIYTNVGTYTVILKASNAYSSDTETKYHYITAFNGGINQTNTAINGLTITNCGGPQTVTVDTSVLPADLILNKFVLEIQPPHDRGLKNITIYAQNGVGFIRNGNNITGNPTGVHLVSEDIAPPAGFSNTIGKKSSFNYSIDLPSYPCNAVLSTKIWEGIPPEHDTKLQKIASRQSPIAVPIGTAYTATITRTNFPSSAPVKLHMSVNSSWNDPIYGPLSGGPGTIFIWRISDDEKTGQILPTDKLSTDPVNKLDYFAPGSPYGMSTFGLSSFTGNNNPFQLITLAAAAYVQPQNAAAPEINAADQPVTPPVTATPRPAATPVPNATTPSPRLPEGVSAKVYANADGVITQATTLTSADGFVTVSTGTGINAKDRDGKPLASITLIPVPAGNLPGALPGGAFTFAGRAYDLQPDGAVFSPGISLIFTAPRDALIGQDFSVKSYDRATGTWQDVPTRYDPKTGMITGQVSHLSTFALFARTITAVPSAAVTNTPSQPADLQAAAVPPTAMSIAVGLVEWVVRQLAENMIIVVAVIILVAVFLFYERKQRREQWK